LCLKKGFQLSEEDEDETAECLEPYLDYRLDYLKPYVPHSLFKYLISKNIKTIGDFNQLDFKQFILNSNLSVELNERLRVIKNTFEKRPNRIIKVIQAHKSEIILPIENIKDDTILPDDFLSAFHQILESYLLVCKDERIKTLIRNRFGLEGNKNTLEEIGIYFNKTREWVRLKEAETLRKLTKLLNGKGLAKPFCSCLPEYIDSINNFKNQLIPKYATEKSKVLALIKETSKTHFNKYRRALFDTLLNIWNVKTCSFRNVDYILNASVSESLFLKTSKAIFDLLVSKVITCSKFDIVIHVKKKVSKNVSNDLIFELLEIIQDINMKNEGNYEIDFNCLTNVKEKAFRILYENQDTMLYQDIWREINHRLVSSGNKYKSNVLAMTTRMSQDSRFVAIGKSGVWGLSEWNVNTDTLIELISLPSHIYIIRTKEC